MGRQEEEADKPAADCSASSRWSTAASVVGAETRRGDSALIACSAAAVIAVAAAMDRLAPGGNEMVGSVTEKTMPGAELYVALVQDWRWRWN